jgi:hypothetical protein
VNSSDNPIDSPYVRPEDYAQRTMPIGKIVAIVLIATFAGALVGGAIGFLMGLFLPEFYRSMGFGGGPVSDPIQLGTGLGLSEGLMLGFVLGCLIVLVQAFGRKRKSA